MAIWKFAPARTRGSRTPARAPGRLSSSRRQSTAFFTVTGIRPPPSVDPEDEPGLEMGGHRVLPRVRRLEPPHREHALDGGHVRLVEAAADLRAVEPSFGAHPRQELELALDHEHTRTDAVAQN